MANPVSKCPVNHSGAELVTHSFAQVAESFAGFKSNRDHEEYTPRGGYKRPNKKPHAAVPAMAPWTKAPGYGVESTFNQQQFAYVAISIAGLNKLTRGELLIPHEAQPKRFSEAVMDDVLAQDPKHISFSGAIARKVLGVFDDFGTYYPNLLPALSAMVRTGGSDGAEIAVNASRNMLSAAIQKQDPLEGIEYLVAGASAYKFAITHPYTHNEKTHEVWCPGEAVAKSIIRESGRAAIMLAVRPEIVAAYGTPLLDPYDDDRLGVYDKITARAQDMYHAAQ